MGKEKVVVKEVLGDKVLTVQGLHLLGHTKEIREKLNDMDVEPEDCDEGEVVSTIKVKS